MSGGQTAALADKVMLVTGASRGIGRAVASTLADQGAVVVLAARDTGRLDAAVGEITTAGGRAEAVAIDVADRASVEAALKRVLDAHGRIDGLVNNAGVTRDNLVLRMKDEDWQAVLSTNLTGVFLCTQAALKPMIKQRSGRIVNITSVVGLIGNAGQANYAASKAGVVGFTKSVAREVASRGITVNAVAPGFVETDMTAAMTDKAREAVLAAIPMGRVGRPEDIAGAVAFLVSDAAGYLTGQVLGVDGGFRM
ncbi:MAG: 3-oxoacyl-[acyl-carrier-protein] reductase [Acidobacteria bacterium]|jgi:3-oxoacyl-[acyl-carrier protein] reductase|nr:3-oxoacyl-[acyl-carrier-protein] reductase [Acidobacteriota bacterium]